MHPTCPFCLLLAEDDTRMIDGHTGLIVPNAPRRAGHILLVPLEHLTDAARHPTAIGRLFGTATWMARQRGHDQFKLQLNNGRRAGQTVDHLHVHLIPY